MEIVWHLHGQSSTMRHAVDHAAKQCGVSCDPVERSIGKNQIDRRFRVPGFDIAQHPPPVRMLGLGLGQHLWRIVHAGDGCIGPALAQLFRAIAGAAAQIDNAGRGFQVDLRDEIGCGPRALIGVF